MMISNFEQGKCKACKSDDLATYVVHWEKPIPPGIMGFIGCRQCGQWEHRETIQPAQHIHDDLNWKVTKAGHLPYP